MDQIPTSASRRFRERPATIYDVVRLAGVSHQTVSRVLNGSPRLREATLLKVEAAMASLNSPSQPVGSLTGGEQLVSDRPSGHRDPAERPVAGAERDGDVRAAVRLRGRHGHLRPGGRPARRPGHRLRHPQRGVDVSGQVIVTGYDDIPEAEFYYPPLTTVRQDLEALGRAGFLELLAQLGRVPDGREPIVGELRERASGGPVRAASGPIPAEECAPGC